MELNEVVQLLGWRREEVIGAIRDGIELPKSKKNTVLTAHELERGKFDISEVALDEFITAFEAEQPGRHPPTAVRRELLVEACHQCAICSDSAPLEFHHMTEWAKIGHHDPKHMLAICGTCHSKCTKGIIDHKAQLKYKSGLNNREKSDLLWGELGLEITWDQLRDVVYGIRNIVCSSQSTNGGTRFDFSIIEVEEKNEKNNVSDSYFDMMRTEHEPHFADVNEFLGSPSNEPVREAYLEVTDEIRTQLAAVLVEPHRAFEHYLIDVQRKAKALNPGLFKSNGRVLNVLLSYMYFCCDIGKK